MTEKPPYSNFDHDKFARSQQPKDFWSQIRRTVNGKPVSENQIATIVGKIVNSLYLSKSDNLLDLACGNGALSSRLFDYCSKVHGVDLSEYLIEVANENFQRPGTITFTACDAKNFLVNDPHAAQYTKVLCYGSFSYFSATSAEAILKILCEKYVNVSHVFIGNLPDYDKRNKYFTHSTPSEHQLTQHTTSIGIWRTRSAFEKLATNAGWRASISEMPKDFYGAGYRYDVTLER